MLFPMINEPQTRLAFVAFNLGLSTLGLQILVFREQLVSFQGNELTVGIILASWLFWSGMGSLLGKYLHGHQIEKKLVLVLLAFAASCPITLLAFRSIRWIFNINSGELADFHLSILTSFLLLIPFFLRILCTSW